MMVYPLIFSDGVLLSIQRVYYIMMVHQGFINYKDEKKNGRVIVRDMTEAPIRSVRHVIQSRDPIIV